MRGAILLAIIALIAVGIAGYFVFMTLAAPGTTLDRDATTTSTIGKFIISLWASRT